MGDRVLVVMRAPGRDGRCVRTEEGERATPKAERRVGVGVRGMHTHGRERAHGRGHARSRGHAGAEELHGAGRKHTRESRRCAGSSEGKERLGRYQGHARWA